jgi:hypothetical protein
VKDDNLYDEIEAALEFFLQDVQSISNEAMLQQQQAENAERKLMLLLNVSRNKLLTINTIIVQLTLVFALGSVVGAMFGE